MIMMLFVGCAGWRPVSEPELVTPPDQFINAADLGEFSEFVFVFNHLNEGFDEMSRTGRYNSHSAKCNMIIKNRDFIKAQKIYDKIKYDMISTVETTET